MSTTGIDERTLFIASNVASLDDFLKTALSEQKHVYCNFASTEFHYMLRRALMARGILSISFQDARTFYPPFTTN
ncbi:hypothetical protein [Vibrio tapetis]|uniref:Uncharacterized protein n=2 Tax=Vibrio tapetis TaxID=52443 RepID=A0A2N8ZNG7_9VIBR|nr:hypothetical protein [Vibrio tapetis]ACB99611.1 conserved protein [Vibrio tapetis]SON53461.1 conserved protein of unknown function [Vibrio tapetis subsp. tapetis]